MSQWRYGACCFGVARAWWTSSQILFSKNSSNHGEDVAFYRKCQGKYTAHKNLGRSWDRNEKCNQEILEGRRLQRASGQLIIELIREQCNPNNTQTNCFKSGLVGKWVHHLHDSSSPHELDVQMQMKHYKYCCILLIFFPSLNSLQ